MSPWLAEATVCTLKYTALRFVAAGSTGRPGQPNSHSERAQTNIECCPPKGDKRPISIYDATSRSRPTGPMATTDVRNCLCSSPAFVHWPPRSSQQFTVGRSFKEGRRIVVGLPDGGRVAFTPVFAACPLVSLVADRLEHVVRCHERFLTGVELDSRKAARRERLQRV